MPASTALTDGRARAAAQDARHDPARHRRHRRADAPEHRRVVADGAGQRAVRVRGQTPPAPARPQDGRACSARGRSRRWSLMLSPFAPHTAEELWELLGHADGLATAAWPAFDAEVAKAEEIVVPVQVNGKVRARLTVPADVDEDELRERALADPAVRSHTAGKTGGQGGRGEGPAGERGGEVGERSTERCAASTDACSCRWPWWLRCCRSRAAATPWPAAGRSCPNTSGRSACRRSATRTPFFDLEQLSPRRCAPS